MTEQHKATPAQWAEIDLGKLNDGLKVLRGLCARVEALEAAQHAHIEGSPDRCLEVHEYRPAMPTTPSPAGPLLWVLWNHLGGSSPIGQPIRQYLGMGQFERMTEEQVEAAKQYRDCMAMPTAPSPAGSLVERVADAIAEQATSAGIVNDRPARAAIREVAVWLRAESEGYLRPGLHWAKRLEQEATP